MSVNPRIPESSFAKKETVDIDTLLTFRIQERQQVKDQQSYISAFVAYLTIPNNS